MYVYILFLFFFLELQIMLRASPITLSILSLHVEISTTFYLFEELHSLTNSLFFLYSI